MADWWYVERPQLVGVESASEIYYWGHYPVADLEYETHAPVKVALRAWSPFVPGDAILSNTPAALFEVHLRNVSSTLQQGAVAFNFPGPTREEALLSDDLLTPWKPAARCVVPVEGRQTLRDSSEAFLPPSMSGDIPVHDQDSADDSYPRLMHTLENPKAISNRRSFEVDHLRGVTMRWASGVGYSVGVIDEERVRTGGRLGAETWNQIGTALPEWRNQDNGSSIALDFSLKAGEERIVRFVLAWYAPTWRGSLFWTRVPTSSEVIPAEFLGYHNPWFPGTPEYASPKNIFKRMYATRFNGPEEVATFLATEHSSILQRILAWQAAIYTRPEMPPWLKDSLINNFAILPEDTYWAAKQPPLGDWLDEGGYLGLMESPRSSAITEAPSDSWYGTPPIIYFFPDLARTTLRQYKHFQRDDGAIPHFLGPLQELAWPATYEWQEGLDGVCFVSLVDRLWLRTGDDSVLREFYPAVKKCMTYTMNLRRGPGSVISMPEGNHGREWWESVDWYGMVTHLGGMRLSSLKIAARMAERMRDIDFRHQCEAWYDEGHAAMEEYMWTGQYYLHYNELETGRKSDTIMANQLDGEWEARFHGFPEGVFRADRVSQALAKVKQTCLNPLCGAVSFADPNGKQRSVGYGIFPCEVALLGMTYLYCGDSDTGLKIIEQSLYNTVLRHRHGWDGPNMIRADTGARTFETEAVHNMILWALPATFAGQDLRGPCAPGGIVHDILQAGKKAGQAAVPSRAAQQQ